MGSSLLFPVHPGIVVLQGSLMLSQKDIVHFWKSQNAITKALIVAVLGLVVFAYLPTLQFDYVTQDQWRAFRYSSNEQSFFAGLAQCSSMISSFYIQTGRPFVWPTECVEHALVGEISDFKYLRPLSLAVVIFTVVYLASIISAIMEGRVIAFVVSAVFITAPAYSFMYLQGLPALMVLISVVLSAASYKRYTESLADDRDRYKLLLRSSLLFLAACMIYPVFAFISLPLALMKFACSSVDGVAKKLKDLIATLTFYGLLSGIYFLFVKLSVLILTHFRGKLPSLGTYEVSAQLSPAVVFERISAVTSYFFMMSPMNVPTFRGASFAILVAFSVALGFTSLLRSQQKKYLTASLLVGASFLIFCAVLLLSATPWLLSKMDNLTTRHVLPFYLFLSFAFVFTLKAILQSLFKMGAEKIAMTIVLLVLVPISVAQNRNSFLEVASTRAEIEMLRSKISQGIKTGGLTTSNRFILVVRPDTSRPRPIGIENLLAEDKYATDNAVLASSKNPVSIPWMINAIFREELPDRRLNIVDCGFDTNSCVGMVLTNPKNIALAYINGAGAPKSDLIKSPTQPYVINISELTSKPVNPIFKIVESPSTSATSMLDDFGPQGLFMGISPGWHAKRNPEYPQTLSIDFKERKHLDTISFLPQQQHSTRAPKSIEIEISDDHSGWRKIYKGELACESDSESWRKVTFDNSVSARYMRINIFKNCGDPHHLTLRGLSLD
jgi:hypothetical protein